MFAFFSSFYSFLFVRISDTKTLYATKCIKHYLHMCLCETYLLGQQLKAQHEFFIHFSEKKRKEGKTRRKEKKTRHKEEEERKQTSKKEKKIQISLLLCRAYQNEEEEWHDKWMLHGRKLTLGISMAILLLTPSTSLLFWQLQQRWEHQNTLRHIENKYTLTCFL